MSSGRGICRSIILRCHAPAPREFAAWPDWGLKCFPPNLNLMSGLQDVRGYDAVDPARYVQLLKLACDPKQPSVSYAATQMVNPKLLDDGNELKLHPVADLLNVRYIIARKRPPGLAVLWNQDDYCILENRHALLRAFVPRTVRVVQSDEEMLAFMEPVEFNPVRVSSRCLPRPTCRRSWKARRPSATNRQPDRTSMPI